ncbi:hypothetical protein, partial [Coralloluteibacterium thermophilus]
MAKRRVTVYNAAGRPQAFVFDDEATPGAVLGKNLRWPDGRLVSAADFGAAPAPGPDPNNGIAETLWSFVGEIPANVVQVERLDTTGFVTRLASGQWVTRGIDVEPGELTVHDGEGATGNPRLGLADVEPAEAGELRATEFDEKGRRIAERVPTTDDLAE